MARGDTPSLAVPIMLTGAAGAALASGMIAAAQGIGHGIWEARENAILNKNAANVAKMRAVLAELSPQINFLFSRLIIKRDGYLDITSGHAEEALLEFLVEREGVYDEAVDGFHLIELLRDLAFRMIARMEELDEQGDEEVLMELESEAA